MTSAIIITICILLLIAYVFELTSSKTKIPSVVLLLFMGWAVKELTILLDIHLPNFSLILPALGTIGLILIVLEGSLELELNRSKFGLIGSSFLAALGPMITLGFLLVTVFRYVGTPGLKTSLINAVPLCIISSAVAIPSVRNLTSHNREFIIYESSFSEILGILIFNFLMLNDTIDKTSFKNFTLQIVLITFLSFLATIGLSFLLSKIEHHIKFIPIIVMVILIYVVSKIYHLPALIFVLIFGLAMGNLVKLKRFKWIEKFQIDELNKEAQKFKELTNEGSFLIRTLFFLIFGYSIDTREILNIDTFIWALAIGFFIFAIRAIYLKLTKLPIQPLLFVAPRGLITILLFLSIGPKYAIPFLNKSLIIQVIVLTALVMMLGLMICKPQTNEQKVSEGTPSNKKNQELMTA